MWDVIEERNFSANREKQEKIFRQEKVNTEKLGPSPKVACPQNKKIIFAMSYVFLKTLSNYIFSKPSYIQNVQEPKRKA